MRVRLSQQLFLRELKKYGLMHGKYISVKAPGQERFVRTKTLGEEYTEESLNTRILYREVGAGATPDQDSKSQLRAAYIAIIGDVRILAEQHKKIQRKRVQTFPYSADNDLDVYKLSALLSVISKDRISSIGELEGRIARLRAEYEKQRQEINNYIEEHNRLVSLLEQAELFKALFVKSELTAAEELKLNVCRQAMEDNGIRSEAEIDRLRKDIAEKNKKKSPLKEKLEGCRQRYDVYSDIAKTYAKISKGDYLSNLVEEEKKRREKKKKKIK